MTFCNRKKEWKQEGGENEEEKRKTTGAKRRSKTTTKWWKEKRESTQKVRRTFYFVKEMELAEYRLLLLFISRLSDYRCARVFALFHHPIRQIQMDRHICIDEIISKIKRIESSIDGELVLKGKEEKCA